MKELVVVSGKGGTGKTSLVAAFAALSENKVLADCDVDAADLHLVMEPRARHEEDFIGGLRASIAPSRCSGCGECQRLCRYEAISVLGDDGTRWIDPLACEGCSVCARFCSEEAIALEDAVSGRWFVSDTRHGPMVHARLAPAEENSGKLVSLVRRQAREIAEESGLELVIVDGPPGIGCPVIASLSGADLALVVAEPTRSSLHDLRRVSDLASHFGVRTAVCINKWDLNPEMADEVESDTLLRGGLVVGRVRYDSAVTRAQIVSSSVAEYTGGAVTQDVQSVWRHLVYALG